MNHTPGPDLPNNEQIEPRTAPMPPSATTCIFTDPIETMRNILLIALMQIASAGHTQTFTLSSPDLGGQATMREVFNGFGCTGGNISPALNWSNIPAGTKSFAITMYDPDAPTGSGFWHWVLFDLPADLKGLPSGAGAASGRDLPPGATQSRTDFGTTGYGGPCPPPGDRPHRYILTVHALATEQLGLPSDAPAALVGFNVNAHSLGQASLIFYYGR